MSNALNPGATAAPIASSGITTSTSLAEQPAPPSQVADVDYPNVPDVTEPQQAATDPSAGGLVSQEDKVPFKEQVNGYAKKIAGTVFGNKHEKEFGEQKLAGNV